MTWKFIAREAMTRRTHWDIWLEEERTRGKSPDKVDFHGF
jgi:hypothetical protein